MMIWPTTADKRHRLGRDQQRRRIEQHDPIRIPHGDLIGDLLHARARQQLAGRVDRLASRQDARQPSWHGRTRRDRRTRCRRRPGRRGLARKRACCRPRIFELAQTPAPAPAAKPAAAKPAPAAAAEKRGASTAETTVRVDTHRLDGLVDAAGELVLVRNRLTNLAPRGTNDPMERAIGELERVAEDLQNAALRMRMQPVGKLFSRFPRIIRDLARQLGKEIELVTEGEETDIDRTVVEALTDPPPWCTCCATPSTTASRCPTSVPARASRAPGTVRLAAGQFGDRIVITVTDDGKGMDPEVLRRKAVEKGLMDEEQAARLDERECFEIVFRPGFSTAAQVSDISGRGVGMDVVKTKIVELGGTLSIDSRVGHGSTVRLSVPPTLAILRVLMVRVGSRLLSLPLSNVAEVFRTRARPDPGTGWPHRRVASPARIAPRRPRSLGGRGGEGWPCRRRARSATRRSVASSTRCSAAKT